MCPNVSHTFILNNIFGFDIPNHNLKVSIWKWHENYYCTTGVLLHQGIGTLSRLLWPRGLSHELSSPTQTLGSWVRIPLEAWMSERHNVTMHTSTSTYCAQKYDKILVRQRLHFYKQNNNLTHVDLAPRTFTERWTQDVITFPLTYCPDHCNPAGDEVFGYLCLKTILTSERKSATVTTATAVNFWFQHWSSRQTLVSGCHGYRVCDLDKLFRGKLCSGDIAIIYLSVLTSSIPCLPLQTSHVRNNSTRKEMKGAFSQAVQYRHCNILQSRVDSAFGPRGMLLINSKG
jgi:hypothetical protein